MNALQKRFGRGRPARVFIPRLAVSPSDSVAARVSGRLRFTECLFAGVLAFAYLVSISTPLFGIQLHQTVLTHFPLMLLLPVLVMHMAGLLFNRDPPPWRRVFGLCWPLFVLALFILIGSSVAKWTLDVSDTFITFGSYLILLPLYIAFTAKGERVLAWARTLICIWVFFSFAALVGQIARPATREALHEIEYLVASGFFVLFYAVRQRPVKVLALVCMLAAAVLNQKLTGYLCAALALMHIVLLTGWRETRSRWRGFYAIAMGTLSVLLVGLLALLYFEFRSYLPSGSAEVRLAQYEQAMRQFVDSPLWGSAFLSGSGELFSEGLRRMNIPTHSDVLDVLKHGGLIGFGLFAWGFVKLFIAIHRGAVATVDNPLINAYFVGARYFLITAVLTFAVNPLLLKGPFVIVIWSNLGLAAGLAAGILTRAAGAAASR